MDVMLRASFAYALVGHCPNADDLDDLDDLDGLKRYDGIFALPKRFAPLYGRERRLTLHGGSQKQQLDQMRKLLLLHTVGRWSHWAVLKKVLVGEPY